MRQNTDLISRLSTPQKETTYLAPDSMKGMIIFPNMKNLKVAASKLPSVYRDGIKIPSST